MKKKQQKTIWFFNLVKMKKYSFTSPKTITKLSQIVPTPKLNPHCGNIFKNDSNI